MIESDASTSNRVTEDFCNMLIRFFSRSSQSLSLSLQSVRFGSGSYDRAILDRANAVADVRLHPVSVVWPHSSREKKSNTETQKTRSNAFRFRSTERMNPKLKRQLDFDFA